MPLTSSKIEESINYFGLFRTALYQIVFHLLFVILDFSKMNRGIPKRRKNELASKRQFKKN